MRPDRRARAALTSEADLGAVGAGSALRQHDDPIAHVAAQLRPPQAEVDAVEPWTAAADG
jgi:hypothetical protein